jgi:hypothetical protein
MVFKLIKKDFQSVGSFFYATPQRILLNMLLKNNFSDFMIVG